MKRWAFVRMAGVAFVSSALVLVGAMVAGGGPAGRVAAPTVALTGNRTTVVTPTSPPMITWHGNVPAMPASGAPLAAWQEWASAQRAAAAETPVAAELAAKGYRLTSPVYLVPVGHIPGSAMPSGITIYTISFSMMPIEGTGSATASSDPSTCGTIGGPGTACVDG